MDGTSILNNIRVLRFQHGEMTQKELAMRVGVTRDSRDRGGMHRLWNWLFVSQECSI